MMSSNLSQAINQPPIKLYHGAAVIEPSRSCLPHELIEARQIGRLNMIAILAAGHDSPILAAYERNPYSRSDGRFDIYNEAALDEFNHWRFATGRR